MISDTGDHKTYLLPENKVVFWECPSCKKINATVISEKARCVGCGSMPMKPKPLHRSVI